MLYRFYQLLLAVLVTCSILGTFWISPLALPYYNNSNLLAHLTKATGKFYTSDYRLDASLTLQRGEKPSNEVTNAQNITLKLHDSSNTAISAHAATLIRDLPISFTRLRLDRSTPTCNISITSPRGYYNAYEKELSLESPVSISSNQSTLSMEGINIPLKEKYLLLGKNLTGMIDPRDSCILDILHEN